MSSIGYTCIFKESQKYEEKKLQTVQGYIISFLRKNEFSLGAYQVKILSNPEKTVQDHKYLGHVSWKENGPRSMTVRVRIKGLRRGNFIEDHFVKIAPKSKSALGAFRAEAAKLDPSRLLLAQGDSTGHTEIAVRLTHAQQLQSLEVQIEKIDEVFSDFLSREPSHVLDVGRIQSLFRDSKLLPASFILDSHDLRTILSLLKNLNPGKWEGRQLSLEHKARIELALDSDSEAKSTDSVGEKPLQRVQVGLLERYYKTDLPQLVAAYESLLSLLEKRLRRLKKVSAPEIEYLEEKVFAGTIRLKLSDLYSRRDTLDAILSEIS